MLSRLTLEEVLRDLPVTLTKGCILDNILIDLLCQTSSKEPNKYSQPRMTLILTDSLVSSPPEVLPSLVMKREGRKRVKDY